MPRYDYRCDECSAVFEVERPMSSTAEEMCPACGGPATRVFTPVGVAFKGSGFHNTDYRPKPPSESCPSAGSSSSCSNCPAAE
jgi:putative FmdB family regulatory protein